MPPKRTQADSGLSAEPRASKRHRGEGAPAASGSSAAGLQTTSLQLLETLSQAHTKSGESRAALFMTKPPKKEYPDYYKVIQQPIAFDDIRRKISQNAYASLSNVKADFELCFTNAKTYNEEGSQVYTDADLLLKLANKTYKQLVPADERSEAKEEKSSSHGLNKLLKSCLKKLMDLTDDEGRIICEIFKELPPKNLKEYYREIEHPECLDNISKRVKGKEYSSVIDFASDMELIFKNAMQFNPPHDQIFIDAITLKTYFKDLMTEFPAPFNIPQYSKKPSLKIKMKLPAAPQSATAAAAQSPAPAVPTTAPASARKTAAPRRIGTAPSLPTASVTAPPPILPAAPNKPVQAPAPELPKAPATVVSSAKAAPPPPSLPTAPNTTSLPTAPNVLPVATASSLPVATNTAAPPAPSPSIPQPSPAAKAPAQPSARTISQPPKPAVKPSLRALRNATTPQQPKQTTPRNPPTQSTFHAYQPPNVIPPQTTVYSNSTYYAPPTTYATQQYQSPAPSVQQPAATPSNIITSSSPAPDTSSTFPLRFALLKTQPRGRDVVLDHRTGVLSWYVNLAPDETNLVVKNIMFMDSGHEDEDDGGSGEDDNEESDEDVDMDSPQPTTSRGRRGGRGRGGRSRKKGKNAASSPAKAKKAAMKRSEPPRPGDVEVKMDGALMSQMSEGEGWTFSVSAGSHVVELGERSGMAWKVYINRR